MLIKYFESKPFNNLIGVYYVEAFETVFTSEGRLLVMYFPYGPKRITISNFNDGLVMSDKPGVMYAYQK